MSSGKDDESHRAGDGQVINDTLRIPTPEKQPTFQELQSRLSEDKDPSPSLETADESLRPKGKAWMYKSFNLGPFTLPHYASPMAQLLIVAFVCFLCPGMFNAVNGLGGAGLLNKDAANNGNIALYSCFAVVGFCAGSITNVLGTRFALFFGGFGYCLYVASLLCYVHTTNAGFVIFAGALVGVCAGCLWAAQGTVMMSYPEEKNKGKYIGIFWVIFNLGGVIGSL
ncbi:hypothetical protein KEM54_004309, partial [Ascosphaera aggregata]